MKQILLFAGRNALLLLFIAAGITQLSGCSMLPAAVDQAEETAATAMVQSSERTICRNIPVGTWMRMYGTNAARREAWRALCTTVQTTPAPDVQAPR